MTTAQCHETQFDRTRDQEQVARAFACGLHTCEKVFDIEGINLDDLIATALDDPQAIADENTVVWRD